MNPIETLEREALTAFCGGIGWTEFWPTVAERVKQAEPWSRERFKRLYDRLLSLVTSGDCSGMTAVGDTNAEPWELDDSELNKPADVGTQARCLFPMRNHVR